MTKFSPRQGTPIPQFSPILAGAPEKLPHREKIHKGFLEFFLFCEEEFACSSNDLPSNTQSESEIPAGAKFRHSKFE
jgi:hypothetical protein